MRRMSVVLVCALAWALVAPPDAAAGGFRIGLNGGIARPTHDFKSDAERGFIGGIDFDYVTTGTLALGIDGSFVSNRATDEHELLHTIEAGAPVKETFRMLLFGIHLKAMSEISPESRITPYVVLGLGITRLTTKLESSNPSYSRGTTNSYAGLRAGLGLSCRVGERVGVGAEGAFYYVGTKVVSFLGGEITPSTQFVVVQAGLTIDVMKAPE